jgi:hypothetical protein
MKPIIIDSIDNIFHFGKHKGQSIKQVALIDPDYVEWLCKTVHDFHITEQLIDSLSDYCLSIFFENPESYLNEKGNFTLTSWQYLKLGTKEVTVGFVNTAQKVELLKSNRVIPHISDSFARKVFDGETCKKNLNERKSVKLKEDDENYNIVDHDDYIISDEELRSNYNDAYEIGSN